MSNEHTPGTWQVLGDDVVALGESVQVGVATTQPNLHRSGNANLIAAAPGLLAALIDCADLMMAFEPNNWADDERTVYANAEAAIAQARGK